MGGSTGGTFWVRGGGEGGTKQGKWVEPFIIVQHAPQRLLCGSLSDA